MPRKTIKKEVEAEVEIEAEIVESTPETPVVDNTADAQELAELKALAEGLAKRNVGVDSRLQNLIEQLEKKLN